MGRTVLRSGRVVHLLDRMVKVKLYTDGAGEGAARNAKLLETRFRTVALPLYVLLDGDGREIARVNRKVGEDAFVAFLESALAGPGPQQGK
jgi:hypothetical protein